jgi:hypothetical protein
MNDNRCEARVCVGARACEIVATQLAQLDIESKLPCEWHGLVANYPELPDDFAERMTGTS